MTWFKLVIEEKNMGSHWNINPELSVTFPLDRAFQKSLVFPLSCSFGMTLVVSSILKGWTPAGPVLRLSE